MEGRKDIITRDNKRYQDKHKQNHFQIGNGTDEQDYRETGLDTSERDQMDISGVPSPSTNKAPLRSKKLLKMFGGLTLGISICGFIFFTDLSTVDTSTAAENALTDQVSAELAAGTLLLRNDEELTTMDHNIVHNSAEDETKIWVWDYAAEDGDYVQIIVNGTPISDSFMIKHKPKEFTVPAVGTVQIKGIRDGGGGITYAVRYDINGTSYFNTAPINGENTYELIRE
ncbi:hypothetical protein [Alkalihalobacillus trypoxylicola]|uniref:Uncharacterized protein n=1 Tax=Alkalihalobacillus trypoxylicola TaxID=519424 RepID=A0A162DGY5_9BACI|nr:hypothetical protein [Alkalihalobacillus trypoxylicola]KYG29600.1 hypothetical protein AZF04_08790 [Alkalihalobacillus trypoxylicola]